MRIARARIWVWMKLVWRARSWTGSRTPSILPFHHHQHWNLNTDCPNNHFQSCYLGIFPEGELQVHGLTKNPPIGTGAADSRRVTEEEKRSVSIHTSFLQLNSYFSEDSKVFFQFFFLNSFRWLHYYRYREKERSLKVDLYEKVRHASEVHR